jgi:hypothetical protein
MDQDRVSDWYGDRHVCGDSVMTMFSSTVSGDNTEYTNAQDGLLVVRTPSAPGVPMIDILPGSSPGVLDDGTLITVCNASASALMAIGVGSGAVLDDGDRKFVWLGPKQTASFVSDGANYRSISKPDFAKLSYGSTIELFVDPVGSDDDCGLMAGTAFATLQAVWNFAAFNIHINSGSITINLADGTYTQGVVCNGFHIGYGFGAVTFRGNLASPQNVVVSNPSGGNGCFLASDGASIYVEGMTLISAGGANCLETNWAALIFFRNVRFGATGNCHLQAITWGYIEAWGSYEIVGGGSVHAATGSQGFILLKGVTITLTGTPNFASGFVNASLLSMILNQADFSGAGTGPKYSGQANSVIINAGPHTLPGNAAGSVSSGAQFSGL